LKTKISESTFREDLFYRLNVISIDLAPLRERKEDIKPLAEYFVSKFSSRCQGRIRGFSKEALEKLVRYDWPGNIRELENVVERAVVLCRGARIESRDLPLISDIKKKEHIVESLQDMERDHINRILENTKWNLSEAAKKLGIHRNTLRSKIKEYQIEKNSELQDREGKKDNN